MYLVAINFLLLRTAYGKARIILESGATGCEWLPGCARFVPVMCSICEVDSYNEVTGKYKRMMHPPSLPTSQPPHILSP